MFEISLIIGLYSYLIFFLGLLGMLSKNSIIVISLLYFLLTLFFLHKFNKINLKLLNLKLINNSKLLMSILFVQLAINLVGVFGPEISFDALWYHLTLPKLYLQQNLISHITGGLLYYSDMPKLIEMLYIPAISIFNEIAAKLIHFSFGVLTIIAIYKLSRMFFSQKISLVACIIFYSNLIVGWESISAYTDLGSAFFTTIALYGFFKWIKYKKYRNLIFCGISTGFAITAKVISIDLLLIFIVLIFYINLSKMISLKQSLVDSILISLSSIMVPLPWFLFSFFNTGNPFYPLFDLRFNFPFNYNLLNVLKLFLFSSDPLNPIYLILIPFFIFTFKRYNTNMKILSLFVFLSIIFWALTSQIGGARFFLPYLPAFSVLSVSILEEKSYIIFKKYVLYTVMLIAFVSIFYRGLANFKYIPVLVGNQSKAQFLKTHLNFSFGDFYDTDGYFKIHIKPSDVVLLFGFHNLYYVNFSFIDSSWIKSGDRFNYIATQNTKLPKRFSDWKKIYYNNLTKVSLYTKEGKIWAY